MNPVASVTVYFVVAPRPPGSSYIWPGTAADMPQAMLLLRAAQSAEPDLTWNVYSLTTVPIVTG